MNGEVALPPSELYSLMRYQRALPTSRQAQETTSHHELLTLVYITEWGCPPLSTSAWQGRT
jgi:hypothetical protein